MRLKKVPEKDPKRRLSVSIRGSVLLKLQRYRAYYKEVYGSEIDLAVLLEEIVNEYIDGDTKFKKSNAANSEQVLDAELDDAE